VIERLLRKGEQALSLRTTQFDNGSQRVFSIGGLITITALLLAPSLNRHHLGTIGENSLYLGWVGIGVAAIGLTLRYWAAKTLGKFYTRTLRIIKGQQIIEQGLYKVIRHPGYLGMFLSGVGTGLATINWVVVGIVTTVGLIVYPYRIQAEEKMLQATFGRQYEAYAQRTWRLFPLIF
jgi:protein-S-isoprenylcysteine O-methyltransferase Ste14